MHNGSEEISYCYIHYDSPDDISNYFQASLNCNSDGCNCTGQISNSTTGLDNNIGDEIEVWVEFKDSSGAANTTQHINNTLPNHKPQIGSLSTVNINGEHAFNVSTTISDADNDTLSCTAYLNNTISGTTCSPAMVRSGDTCYLKINTSTCTNFNVKDWIDIIAQVNDPWNAVNSSEVSSQIPNEPPSIPQNLTLLINDSHNDSAHVITHHPLLTWTSPTDPEGDNFNITAYTGTSINPTTKDNETETESMTLGWGVGLKDGSTYYYRIRACDPWDCSDYLGDQSNNFTMNSNPSINWVRTEPQNLTGVDKINLTANITDDEGDAIIWANFTVYYSNYSTAENKTALSLNNTQGYHILKTQNASSTEEANLTIFYEYQKEERANNTLLQVNSTPKTHRILVGNPRNPAELNITLDGTGLVNLSINGNFITQINSSKGTYYNNSITLISNTVNNFTYISNSTELINITQTKVTYFVNNTTQIKINNHILGNLSFNRTSENFTFSQSYLSETTNLTYTGGKINITNSSINYVQRIYIEENTNGTRNGDIWSIYNLTVDANITYHYLVVASDSFETSSTTGEYIKGYVSPTLLAGPDFRDIPGEHGFTTYATAEDLDGWNTLNCTINLTGGGNSFKMQGFIENLSNTEINCSLNVTTSNFPVGTIVNTYFIFTDEQGLNAVSTTKGYEVPNNKPVISSIQIEQEKPTTITDLTIDYTAEDPENDSITSEIYEWYRNGNSTDQISSVLPHQNTKKGENWSICLRVIDEYDAVSEENCSSNVTIQNYPPKLQEIQITNYTGHKLRVLTIASDEDNETDYRNCTLFYCSGSNQSSKSGILNIGYGTNLQAECYENLSVADEIWLIPNKKVNITLEICDGNLTGGLANPGNCTNKTREAVIPNIPPAISLTNPENNTNSTSQNILFIWASSDDDSDDLTHTLKIYNITDLYDNITTSNTSCTVSLSDGIYQWNVSVTDLYNGTSLNITNSETRTITIDTTPPELINSTCNITSNETNKTITNLTGTIQVKQGDNISCTLNYKDNSQSWGIDGLENASLFIIYETGSNSSQNLNFTNNQISFNIIDLPAGHTTINLTTFDWVSNQNITTIQISANDTQIPAIESITHSPSDLPSLDPGINITVSVRISDNLNIDKAVLYYQKDNITSSTELNLSSGTQRNGTYSAILNLPEGNYTYYIWVNDTYGNIINSSQENQTKILQIWYDYTIDASITNVPDIQILNQEFLLGNIIINSTADYNYTCSLQNKTSIKTNYEMNFTYNTSSIEIPPNSQKQRKINATGLEPGTVDITLYLDCSCLNCTPDNADYTATLSLNPSVRIIPSGPYFDHSVQYPSSLTYGKTYADSLELKVKNIGNETAYNVTIHFSNLPDKITISPDSSTKEEMEKEATSWQLWKYYDISVDDSITTGTYCFNITADCENCNSAQNLKEICIPVEGKTKTTVEKIHVGGGGGASSEGIAAGGLTKEQKKKLLNTRETLEVVRKEQQKFTLIVENIFEGPMVNVSVNVSGYLSQYLSLSPAHVEEIPVNKTQNFTIEITAPKYFSRGTYYLNFTIDAIINEPYKVTKLKEYRTVVLIIHEISREEARSNLDKAKQILDNLNKSGFYIKDIEQLVKEANISIENKNYVQTQKILEQVEDIKEKAYKTDIGIKELETLINKAEVREIKVDKTKRLLNLAKAAFRRGDYSTALSRIQEAKLVYAAETKGEFSVGYFIKTNRNKLILAGIIFAIVIIFLIYELILFRIKSKLKSLRKEETILIGLMKQAQKECFEQKKLSMDEYTTAVRQYEKRLSNVVSDIISFEELTGKHKNAG